MKRNILKVTLVVAFALVAGFNVYNSQKSDLLSDLALANVEALARWESDGDVYCPNSGYKCVIKYTNGTYVTVDDRWP